MAPLVPISGWKEGPPLGKSGPEEIPKLTLLCRFLQPYRWLQEPVEGIAALCSIAVPFPASTSCLPWSKTPLPPLLWLSQLSACKLGKDGAGQPCPDPCVFSGWISLSGQKWGRLWQAWPRITAMQRAVTQCNLLTSFNCRP